MQARHSGNCRAITTSMKVNEPFSSHSSQHVQTPGFLKVQTCTTYTSSLPLYQISNFRWSPFTFSVIPTAFICKSKWTKINTVQAPSSLGMQTSASKLNLPAPNLTCFINFNLHSNWKALSVSFLLTFYQLHFGWAFQNKSMDPWELFIWEPVKPPEASPQLPLSA